MENVKQENYLGVIIVNKLSRLPHVKMISCSANLSFCKQKKNPRTCKKDIN